MFTFASFRRRHKKQQQQQQKDWLSILYSVCGTVSNFLRPEKRTSYIPAINQWTVQRLSPRVATPFCNKSRVPLFPLNVIPCKFKRMNRSVVDAAFKGVPGNRERFYAPQQRQPQGIKISSPIISMSAGTLCRIIADPIYESLFDNCIDLPLDSLRNLWPESSWGDEMGAEGQRKTRTTLLALFICCCLLTSCTWKFIASFRINICCLNLFYEFRPSRPFPLHPPVVSVQSHYFTGTIPKTFVNNCFIAN